MTEKREWTEKEKEYFKSEEYQKECEKSIYQNQGKFVNFIRSINDTKNNKLS